MPLFILCHNCDTSFAADHLQLEPMKCSLDHNSLCCFIDFIVVFFSMIFSMIKYPSNTWPEVLRLVYAGWYLRSPIQNFGWIANILSLSFNYCTCTAFFYLIDSLCDLCDIFKKQTLYFSSLWDITFLCPLTKYCK